MTGDIQCRARHILVLKMSAPGRLHRRDEHQRGGDCRVITWQRF